MASNTGHLGTGIGAALVAWATVTHFGYGGASLAALAAMAGSTAPDWMEIPTPKQNFAGKWVRTSVIPHRTITHWLPPWMILFVTSLFLFPGSNFWTITFGFTLGGLVHLAADIPNPAGIPITRPFKPFKVPAKGLRKHQGHRYGWWRSGDWEVVLISVSTLFGWICVKLA